MEKSRLNEPACTLVDAIQREQSVVVSAADHRLLITHLMLVGGKWKSASVPDIKAAALAAAATNKNQFRPVKDAIDADHRMRGALSALLANISGENEIARKEGALGIFIVACAAIAKLEGDML